jgi:hypothetical protein
MKNHPNILRLIDRGHHALRFIENGPSATLSRPGGQKINLGEFKGSLNGSAHGVKTPVCTLREVCP